MYTVEWEIIFVGDSHDASVIIGVLTIASYIYMHPFAIVMMAILVHNLYRFSLCTKMVSMAVCQAATSYF